MSLFISGFIVGFCLYCITAPEEGKNTHLSCIIPIPLTDKYFHLHHWIYLTIFGLPLTMIYFPNQLFLYGFCFGGIIQSFVWYSDSFRIIV